MKGKKIYRYSNVELLDLIKNGTNESLIRQAELELHSRNLTPQQKDKTELEYLNYKKFQAKRKSIPLTNEEWVSFFFLPFFTPKPRCREDHFSESEFERFERYGFDKKASQAQNVKMLGILFWLIVVVCLAIIFK